MIETGNDTISKIMKYRVILLIERRAENGAKYGRKVYVYNGQNF